MQVIEISDHAIINQLLIYFCEISQSHISKDLISLRDFIFSCNQLFIFIRYFSAKRKDFQS